MKQRRAQPERQKPDWTLWLNTESATLWELVSLSMDEEPKFSNVPTNEAEYHRRLALLRTHAARRSKLLSWPIGHHVEERDSIHQVIRIESFRKWAVAQGWSVPEALAPVKHLPEQPAVAGARDLPTSAARVHRLARDLLSPVLDQARRAVEDPDDAAAVMAELERLARLPDGERPAPLSGVNSGGVQWHDGGQVRRLNRKALGDRLRRAAARAGAMRRAEART